MESIRDIIRAAGGTKAVSASVGISADGVRKWATIGIPDRYWETLMAMVGAELTAEILYTANRRARGGSEGACIVAAQDAPP